MIKIYSLFRFYKFNDENIAALRENCIFLYSARKWEADGEFDFDIDIGTDEEYKNFLRERLRHGFNLHESDPEYLIFRDHRYHKLSAYGLQQYIDTPVEFDILLDILMREAHSPQGVQERKQLIKTNFFNKSGICCFTADETTLTDLLHWNNFTNNGQSFCVEYDSDVLSQFFLQTHAYIAGELIKYYSSEDLPKLRLPSDDQDATAKNFHEIFFSLKQSLKDEKEFRLAKVFREVTDDQSPVRKQTVPKESIVSITLGPNISKENEIHMQSIILDSLPNTQLYKVVEEDGVYKRVLRDF